MSRLSTLVLGNTGEELNVTSPPVPVFASPHGIYTLAFYPNNLQGRVYVEASLATVPEEDDWFPLPLSGRPYLDFPLNPFAPTGTAGDSKVVSYTIIGNFLWMRARLDRSHLALTHGHLRPQNVAQMFGTLDKVLINS